MTWTDVLSGRNATIWSHEGNRCFQRVVAHMLGAVNATDKVSRNQIVSQVIAAIHQRGGRFLKKNATTNQWEELPIEKVRAKVSHALRDRLDGETGDESIEKSELSSKDEADLHVPLRRLLIPACVRRWRASFPTTMGRKVFVHFL